MKRGAKGDLQEEHGKRLKTQQAVSNHPQSKEQEDTQTEAPTQQSARSRGHQTSSQTEPVQNATPDPAALRLLELLFAAVEAHRFRCHEVERLTLMRGRCSAATGEDGELSTAKQIARLKRKVRALQNEQRLHMRRLAPMTAEMRIWTDPILKALKVHWFQEMQSLTGLQKHAMNAEGDLRDIKAEFEVKTRQWERSFCQNQSRNLDGCGSADPTVPSVEDVGYGDHTHDALEAVRIEFLKAEETIDSWHEGEATMGDRLVYDAQVYLELGGFSEPPVVTNPGPAGEQEMNRGIAAARVEAGKIHQFMMR